MENKIVVFDMDGVLIDSIELMNQLTQTRYPGATLKESRDLFLGNIHEEIEKLHQKYGSLGEEEGKKVLEEYTKNKVEGVELYRDVQDLLNSLTQQGCKLSINSSAKSENALPILDRHSITEFFDSIYTKDDSKSKVEKFKLIAKHYDVEPSEFLFVTDAVGDVIEALELNINTIAVTYGIHPREYFIATDYPNIVSIVDSIEELQLAITEYFANKK